MIRYKKNALQFVISIALLLLGQVAFAGSGSDAQAASAIMTIVNQIEETLKQLATNTQAVGLGLKMLGFFVLMNVVWALIKGMATGRMLDYMIGELLPIGVAAAVAWMFLGQVNGVENLGKAIENFINAVGSAVAPGTYGGGSVAQIILDTVKSTAKVMVHLLSTNFSQASFGSWSFWTDGAIAVLISMFFKLLMLIVVFVIMVCALCAFIATLIITQTMMYIALLMMPIFIPFMVFKPLESFFDRWLSFFISSLMAKVIGVLIIHVTNKVMLAMVKVSELLKPTDNGLDGLGLDILIYLALILMAFICYILVSRIDNIAKALTGSVAMGFMGFGKELSGGMGGIGKAEGASGTSVGKGGQAMGGASSINATSAITTIMPNAVKMPVRALGNVISKSQGKAAYARDVKRENALSAVSGRNSPFGESKPSGSKTGSPVGGSGQGVGGRDISNMSAVAQQAYLAAARKASQSTTTGKEIASTRLTDIPQGKAPEWQ